VEVLSQSQIDDLLKSLTTGAVDIEEAQGEAAAKKVKEYDFRSPKRFTKEQLKIVTSVYENYSRLLSSYLTAMLRLYVNVECVHIEEQRYSEFNNALPDSIMAAMGEIRFSGANEENNTLIMDMSKPVSFAIIERLLGGTGDGLDVERDFTEIETSLMENVFKGVFPQMADSWANHFEVDTLYRKLETNARLMQSIGADETVVILIMDVQMKDVSGTISICVPAVCLEEVLKKIDSQYVRNLKRISSSGDKERRDLVMQYLSDSNLELRCVIGTTQITLADVMYLNVGDVLQLNKPVGSKVELSVGQSPWFYGKIGVQKNKKAFQVLEVL